MGWPGPTSIPAKGTVARRRGCPVLNPQLRVCRPHPARAAPLSGRLWIHVVPARGRLGTLTTPLLHCPCAGTGGHQGF